MSNAKQIKATTAFMVAKGFALTGRKDGQYVNKGSLKTKVADDLTFVKGDKTSIIRVSRTKNGFGNYNFWKVL